MNQIEKKRIVLLGCTGSIGTSTLSVVEAHRDRFQIVAASANTNESGLLEVGKRFEVKRLALSGGRPHEGLIRYAGENGLLEMVRESDADIVVRV